MNIAKPILAALIFIGLSIYFTNYFVPTLTYLKLDGNSIFAVFISSPFNMTTEGNPLYNLYLPTLLIFFVGFYLKNFNTSFQKKCNLRAIFLMSILASYMKSVGSMLYYRGYADYGISLGTSIITLSFLAVFVISLEMYVEEKEKIEHLYGRFIFAVISTLIVLLAGLTLISFFATSSFLVHLMGITAFLILFIPFYERSNISNFLKKEKTAMLHLKSHA